MSSIVVWLDGDHAKVFTLKPGSVDSQQLKRHETRHHSSADGNKSHEPFYHEVASALKGADEVLIVGPGMAKTHFKKHLESHHHNDIAKKVVGTENMDHPTDKEILAHARKFFKAQHLFA